MSHESPTSPARARGARAAAYACATVLTLAASTVAVVSGPWGHNADAASAAGASVRVLKGSTTRKDHGRTVVKTVTLVVAGSAGATRATLRVPVKVRGVKDSRARVRVSSDKAPAPGRATWVRGTRAALIDVTVPPDRSTWSVRVSAARGRVVVGKVRIRQARGANPSPEPTQTLRAHPLPSPTAQATNPTLRPTPTATPVPSPTSTPTSAPAVGKLTNGCGYTRRGIPLCGAYAGATYQSNADPGPVEQEAGVPYGVRRTFWRADQVPKAVETATGDALAGRLPWISFKLPASWEAMSAGEGDAWVKTVTDGLRTVPGPVWVAFHHEPENDGDILAWRTMQERLAPMVRAAAPNVAFTVILTGWNQVYGPTQFRFADIWPRGVKVDVAGFDIYNDYGTWKNGQQRWYRTDMVADYFDPIAKWAAGNDVVWGLAETGLTDEAYAEDPDWLPRTYAELVDNGGAAFAYFDTTLNTGGSSFPLTGPKLASFGQVLRSGPRLLTP